MLIQRVISAGFAAAALASASVPSLAFTVWPDVDFQWYANVGRTAADTTAGNLEVMPPPRPGYIWSPGHYERVGTSNEIWVAGKWIKDDYYDQVAYYSQRSSAYAQAPTQPTDGSAYPIDSSRR